MDYKEQESFVVIEDAGSIPISLAAIDSIGEDLSLEEAISRLKDLTRQNAELRNTVDTNSKLMRTQIEFLSEWKAGWEQDKTEVKQRSDQAREVVTDLRADIAKKDAKVEQLNAKIAELEAEKSTTPVTVEQQELHALRHKIESLANQIADLTDENNRLTSGKDDICRELDQHTKIVGELQNNKQSLEEENKALQQNNTRLTLEVKVLIEKSEKLNADKQELSQHNEKLLSYSLVGGIEDDAVPAPSAKTVASPVQAHMDKNLADLMSQLQDLRGQNSDLKQAIQTKNQEMEALHRKVHDEAERLVNAEHKHRQAINKAECEHHNSVEQLSNEISRLRSQQSPRSSIDGSPQSFEEVKSLKTQVVSLGNELDSGNEKLKAMEELYQKQKERMQAMEAKLHSQHADMEQDRAKADHLITNFQQAVTSLEFTVANEKQDNILKTSALAENRKKFAQLLHDYHESIAHSDEYKRQLEGMKTGGRYHQQMQGQIDNLTAQLMAADESMAHKTEDIVRLRRERDHAHSDVEKINQILPVLKAQCDIFKNDFEAERGAREKMHQEKEQLREDNETLHIENTHLKDEVQRLSDTQIQMIRDRHAQSGTATLSRTAPTRSPTAVQTVEEDNVSVCPMCARAFPDPDTLQLHCMDCIP